ncbi:hypothetical protein C7391_1148 [Methanimicrococcus blatticola]|uniref:Uncharacterized protein n=1 Tax=Methanimicrococcus blatticola TaxID=91560 RepID=A0A484F2X7_9EURY|nr:hypothetical protein C7391_1148 [Methanimicrococcus blatticola]
MNEVLLNFISFFVFIFLFSFFLFFFPFFITGFDYGFFITVLTISLFHYFIISFF